MPEALYVARTMQVLELLAFQPLSAPQVAATLQIHPRTARRLLVRLHEEGYVTRSDDARRRYTPSMRVVALAGQIAVRAPLTVRALPAVARLHAGDRRRRPPGRAQLPVGALRGPRRRCVRRASACARARARALHRDRQGPHGLAPALARQRPGAAARAPHRAHARRSRGAGPRGGRDPRAGLRHRGRGVRGGRARGGGSGLRRRRSRRRRSASPGPTSTSRRWPGGS